jgi:hypothetical protein
MNMKNFILKSEKLILFYGLLSSTFMIAQSNYLAYNSGNSTSITNLQSNISNAINKKNIYSLITNEWGPWSPDDCFDGIDFRVKKGDYNSYANKWYWYVQFRNRYNKQVYFSYAVDEPGTRPKPDHRKSMDAENESDSAGFLLYSGGQIHVRIGYIRFGSDDSGSYVTCDR